MLAAEIVVKILEKEGISTAFGIPGAAINPVYKYLGESPIEHFLVRHEAAAVHAADGFFRSSSKMALAICTSGPGATNFVTGLYTAKIDSTPLIAITGQAKSSLIGTDAFQCVDIVASSAPFVKEGYCVMNPDEIVETMKTAIWTAREGRQGPVLIDLPLDIQMTDVDFDINSYEPKEITKETASEKELSQAIRILDSAKNPIIIMGGGVVLSHAEQLLLEFATLMNIPVITTYMAKGGIPEHHPLNAGLVGIQVGASSSGNKIFLESDVVLGIGCRFSDRHTGNIEIYKDERKFIHIDVDPSEIGKLITPELGIVSDAYEALTGLLKLAKIDGKRRGSERIAGIAKRKSDSELQGKMQGDEIDPKDIFHLCNEIFKDDVLYTTGCGLVQIWSGQYQKINKARHYLPSGGAGTLGFDIPAAIGASIGVDRKKTICMMGDFGFTFMVEELAVAAKYDVPIVVIILNNSYLSLIRQNQKYAYKYEYAVEMNENKDFVDYLKISKGFGCEGERVESYANIVSAFERAKDSMKPYVLDIRVANEVDCNMGNDLTHIATF